MAIFSEMNSYELDDFFLEGGDELMNSEECPKYGVVIYLNQKISGSIEARESPSAWSVERKLNFK